MDKTILENDFIRVNIKHLGAEMCSLFNKQTAIEHMWQAGEAWPKHAPVLFPIVGQLKNNSYTYGNKEYSLERHGFARTKNFNLQSSTSSKVVFVLKDDETTLNDYPFRFELYITYELHQNVVHTYYEVKNKTEGDMYFSIGAHPAFKVPLLNEEYYSDYYLEFNNAETAPRWLLHNGFIDKPTAFFDEQSHLPLSHSLFKDDALVFKGLRSDIISLRCRKSEHGLHFTMQNYPYLGIWAARNANFVCIEPWHGIADNISASGLLTEKNGIVKLGPHEAFFCDYSIEVF